MDLEAVRTVVTVADAGQFQRAAVDLSLTQQAVSKRVAALERHLGVRLFTRTPHGAELTSDGEAFLPHARELLRAADRAAASIRTRPLRVDVLTSRSAPTGLLRGFHRKHPSVDLEVVTLPDIDAALAALRAGTLDATFRAVTDPSRRLPPDIASTRVLDEPLQLLTGPSHALSSAPSVTLTALREHRIWMPGLRPGSEWAAYYTALTSEFSLRIESKGPNFGSDALLDTIASSPTLTTLMSTHQSWPTPHTLHHIPITHPTPVYPHSLLWQHANAHPALATLRSYLAGAAPGRDAEGTWRPGWVLAS
ncbi:HTH-type transcriptional regulator HdfR [Streptomyces sp. RB5]|uniref:HTH-type transcriptional regulator HdfR n=1 Tax=Streptomyces smaragdinus TaxID=2585196 RepID=A0A7K0CRS9_9ACTN|nr:LysR family transcriptional regulator [Streptomyces smaragdinus]MQY15444.1 HTH-type transcriptional regulator HdfR [Streptomyces smaragdinus]